MSRKIIKSYNQAITNIFKLEKTYKYDLENIKNGAFLLGNPQDNFKIIHIAGTNGKGSVSKMLFSILKKSGKNVGVFTSPHLIDLRERFETNLGRIKKEEFLDILNRILNLNIELSFFDKCVLIAFEFFKLHKCEYVIMEVGIGGKLDTTNIVNPLLTVITSIGFDHQDLLGNTIEEISKQKAGIIKKNIPVFLNFRNKFIEGVAKEKKSKVIFVDKLVDTNLIGYFQKKNAGLAYEIAKYLKIPKKSILKGLQKVEHRGRLEFINSNLLIDGAHNIDSLKELKKYIYENLIDKFEKIIYCFSLKKGKNINLVIDIFGKDQKYILLDIESEMLNSAKNYNNNFLIKNKEYILLESEKNKNFLYVVFGSLYMIGEFLNIK